MYINRSSDLKGQIAAHLVWLGQPSKSHLNGAVWIRSGCFGSIGMRDDAVAESRNCRICLCFLTLMRSVQVVCSSSVCIPPVGEKWWFCVWG